MSRVSEGPAPTWAPAQWWGSGLGGVGLAEVKDGRGPGAAADAGLALFAGVGVRLAGLFVHRHERGDLDAVLAAAHLPAQRPPGVVGEDVLARADVRLGNPLRQEPGEDGGQVGEGLAGRGAAERLLLQFVAGLGGTHE